jgi:hypothetical protein
MSFTIHGDTAALALSINRFRQQYHEDYFRVRVQARQYLEGALSHASATATAAALLVALKSWGAGRRNAPSCKSLTIATQGLFDTVLRDSLRDLSRSFEYLDMVDGKRVLLYGAPFVHVEDFDRCMLTTLNTLAEALLVDNTNVTYPMKALLLLTGLTPAFDGQVKGGLKVGGVSGIAKTSYLLPRADCSDAQKICTLPFYIAHCVARSRGELDTAIKLSRYPMLNGEYGRLFDVLLFMQRRRSPQTALLRFSTTPGYQWYNS